jgi:hypothetical protein
MKKELILIRFIISDPYQQQNEIIPIIVVSSHFRNYRYRNKWSKCMENVDTKVTIYHDTTTAIISNSKSVNYHFAFCLSFSNKDNWEGG